MEAVYFFSTALVSVVCTAFVRKLCLKWNIVDRPKKKKRKIHTQPIALGGGLAIYISFFLLTMCAWFVFGDIGQDIKPESLIALFGGGLILMIGGLLDDRYELSPRYQILFPVIAAFLAIIMGIGIESVTNPTGGIIQLDQISLSIEGLGKLVLFADIIVFFWLMGMMFTTKFLDGLDGLVAGTVIIGACMVGLLSLQEPWFQPEVSLLSFIFAGACFGFLLLNFHPAKIFLGEGGSLFTGFTIGILALISGSKVATTLLVMGVPILDVARVIVMRIRNKKPIFVGDSEHLHFRMLQSGFGHRQAVLFFYGVSFLFGITTLFLQSHQKLIALGFLFILMLLLAIFFMKKEKESV